MASLSTFLKVLWLGCGVLQAAILVLIVARRHYRPLPMFTWYIGLNLTEAIVMAVVYPYFGFHSPIAFDTYWAMQVIVMIVQTLASAEILHRALQDYPGIWELVWRLILVAIIAVVGYSWWTANRGDEWGLLAAHRGFYFTFAVAFVLCLVVVRHYSISIDPVYKILLGGFCFYSCSSIVADSLLKSMFQSHYSAFSDVWNGSQMLMFFSVLVIWAVALWHPVRGSASSKPPIDISGAYESLSPQVNASLREMNDSLRKFFRRQAA